MSFLLDLYQHNLNLELARRGLRNSFQNRGILVKEITRTPREQIDQLPSQEMKNLWKIIMSNEQV